MKAIYPRLALDGIVKNRRIYYPYILTCICMIAMFYILQYIASDECLQYIPRGRRLIPIFMNMGTVIIAIFALIFLFYTNSFLARRRAKEFGLLNVLGMSKKNLVGITFFETLFTAAISLFCGLLLGMTLAKFAELGLVKMLEGELTYRITVLPKTLLITTVVFIGIFAVLMVNSVIRVERATAVNLLKTEAAGEKAPKGNIFLGLAGLLLLAIAYYLAVSTEKPTDAIGMFLTAVLLVIVGTYLLMIFGSVLICSILQKNKGYYYKPAHFVSVSSMKFRMKRNGAGLASICIISTMVLVMTSSASSLWFGSEDSLHSRYPRNINITANYTFSYSNTDESVDKIDELALNVANSMGIGISDQYRRRYNDLSGSLENGVFTLADVVNKDWTQFWSLYLMSTKDYNALVGTDCSFSDDEALLIAKKSFFKGNEITLKCNGEEFGYKIVERLYEDPTDLCSGNFMNTIILVVNDSMTPSVSFENTFNDTYGVIIGRYHYSFNVDCSAERHSDYIDAYNRAYMEAYESGSSYLDDISLYVVADSEVDEDMQAIYGGIFYLGIMLSIILSLAAVLIIYYKQITEGFEDAKRFEIMTKVGMTDREIKKTINSQMLTVFFLPLLLAGVHLAFAFPIIKRLLILFELHNTELFTLTTLVSFAVFALAYMAVYKVTSNIYYSIVKTK